MPLMRVLIAALTNLQPLAAALVQRGLEVSLLQPRYVDLGEFGESRPQPTGDGGYNFHLARVFPIRPYPYSRWSPSVRHLIARLLPDVLYMAGEPSELAVAQLAWLAREASPQTRLVTYTFENVDQDWAGFPRYFRGRAERKALRRLDLIATASETAAARLRRLGYPDERLRVVYRGAESRDFYPRDAQGQRDEAGVADTDFLVGYIGRLVPEKGVDLLLRALAQLPSHVHAVIGGAGPEEDHLRGLAAELHLQDRARFLGRIPRDRVPFWHSACDALVLPSRSIPQWQEQFGMVLAEAMLCETPVIGSSSGAIPEIIGEAGLVFPEEDAKALAEAVRRLLESPQLRAELARRGRERALAHFTEDRYSDGVASVICEAAGMPLNVEG